MKWTPNRLFFIGALTMVAAALALDFLRPPLEYTSWTVGAVGLALSIGGVVRVVNSAIDKL